MMPFPSAPWPDPSAVGLFAGHAVPHEQPPSVSVDCACPHPFRITAFGNAARWFREIGLTRPLRSADREFDARWSVETDDVEFGEALARMPEARAAVKALAELGGCGITQGGKHLTAALGTSERRAIKEPERKAEVEARLRVLAGLCTELCRSRNFPRRRGPVWLYRGVVIGSLLVASLVCVAIAIWQSELVDGALGTLALRSLVVGVPLGVALLAAATVPLAGRSTSHKEFGVLALLLLPAVIAAGLAVALAANRYLDPGPVVAHSLPVLELQERRSGEKRKKLQGYWAIVPAWSGAPGATERIRIGTQSGSRIELGRSTLSLSVSPGRLGAERVLSVAVENPPPR